MLMGLDIALVRDDIPSKLALGIGYVLARKAPASGAEAGAGGAEQAAAEARRFRFQITGTSGGHPEVTSHAGRPPPVGVRGRASSQT